MLILSSCFAGISALMQAKQYKGGGKVYECGSDSFFPTSFF